MTIFKHLLHKGKVAVLGFVLVCSACGGTKIQIGENEDKDYNTPRGYTAPSSPSPRARNLRSSRNYVRAFNLFRSNHGDVLRHLNGNHLAAKSAYEDASGSVRSMLRYLPGTTQKKIKSTFSKYQETWKKLDPKQTRKFQKKRIKSLGSKLIAQLDPEKVTIRAPRGKNERGTQTNREEETPSESAGKTDSSEEPNERERSSDQNRGSQPLPQLRETDVSNVQKYRGKFELWQTLEQKFRKGLRTDDPLLEDTHEALQRVIQELKSLVEREEHKEFLKDTGRTYKTLFENRSYNTEAERTLNQYRDQIHKSLKLSLKNNE